MATDLKLYEKIVELEGFWAKQTLKRAKSIPYFRFLHFRGKGCYIYSSLMDVSIKRMVTLYKDHNSIYTLSYSEHLCGGGWGAA